MPRIKPSDLAGGQKVKVGYNQPNTAKRATDQRSDEGYFNEVADEARRRIKSAGAQGPGYDPNDDHHVARENIRRSNAAGANAERLEAANRKMVPQARAAFAHTPPAPEPSEPGERILRNERVAAPGVQTHRREFDGLTESQKQIVRRMRGTEG